MEYCAEYAAAKQFALNGAITRITRYGNGHINGTFLVETDSSRRYILQWINDRVFDVPKLMANVEAVTRYTSARVDDPRKSLHLVPTLTGESWLRSDSGNYRVYDFVEGTVCLDAPESPADFYESAVGFGSFQQLLADYPAETLFETVPNFHKTVERYKVFHEVLERDPLGRAAFVQPEISFALAHEKTAGVLQRMGEQGELPLRVTHNDTKLNNVLLDAKTRKALCVIDLDTVMPGLSAYDFGDSIRFGAATAAEDEKDLSRMTLDLELFRIFTRGFLSACPGLTEREIEMLPMGAKIMTLECGLRFLTDYLDGDHYFAVHREGHNLDRCRTQFRLVTGMERKWSEMERIIWEEAKK